VATPPDKRDFLTLLDCSPVELEAIVQRALELKREHGAGRVRQTLVGRTVVLIFELHSTRTRVAFEAGTCQLGGHAVVLSKTDSQLGRGEPVEDVARVLSGMADTLVIRTLQQERVEAFAQAASVPVINAMTQEVHPCQLLADVMTFVELRGAIGGARVAFVGDGYNMCQSYMNAARQWGFELRIANPEGYRPDPAFLAGNDRVRVCDAVADAVRDADLVVTDVWSSMGHEAETEARNRAFAPFQVTPALLDLADRDVLFMHCLPAHRGEEVSDDLLDDPRSAVFTEAHNRLHSQKALLEFLLL